MLIIGTERIQIRAIETISAIVGSSQGGQRGAENSGLVSGRLPKSVQHVRIDKLIVGLITFTPDLIVDKRGRYLKSREVF